MSKRLTLSALCALAGLTVMNMQEASAQNWADKTKIKGDIRLREEFINQDDKDERNRIRLRARVGIEAEVSDDLTVKVGVASGSDDPVSTNQTLGEGFSKKGLNIDKAYFIWSPEALGGVAVHGGKMDNPFIATKDLIWDGDLTPEGVALKTKLGDDAMALAVNLGGFQIQERSSDDETYLLGAQAAVQSEGEAVDLTLGVSVYHYEAMQGFSTIYDETDSFGNSTVPVLDDEGEEVSLLYANDYTLVEGFASVGLSGMKLYASVVNNTEASDNDMGFIGGVTFGKAKDPGSMQFDYNYRDLEADAVVGAFTDSDSGGGGTDVSGHKFSLAYQVSKNIQLAGTLFVNEINDGSTDYTRAMLDLIAKF